MGTTLPNMPRELNVDLKRTEPPSQQDEIFYWDSDVLLHVGEYSVNMTYSLSRLSTPCKASFKSYFISFTKQGDYSSITHLGHIKALTAAMNANPPTAFDIDWITKALDKPSFLRAKTGITNLFVHWKERDSRFISNEAITLLANVKYPDEPRNVLSDDPEKSWLTDDEYDSLLSAIWNNYDKGISGTQVTLIRLLSMQYARRPSQIAHLKIGDIRESNISNNRNTSERTINFPGVKDANAEENFRDSKFEPHPLADHLWGLLQIQKKEAKALYEYALDLALTDEQLNKLPLFCSEERIKQAEHIIDNRLQINLVDNLDHRLFHLPAVKITKIIRWSAHTPTCAFGADSSRRSRQPKLPISHRTGKKLFINATRLRHTRARQLARRGVPEHILSHWLGHTTKKSLDAYYNDPAELARKLDESMSPTLAPLAMAFSGVLIDSENQATRASDPTSKLEFAHKGELRNLGRCGKHSFCAATSVPIPCYRCKHFEPLVDAPHQEVLDALLHRQSAEEQAPKIGGTRNMFIPIDLSADIRAVISCITRCNARKIERDLNS